MQNRKQSEDPFSNFFSRRALNPRPFHSLASKQRKWRLLKMGCEEDFGVHKAKSWDFFFFFTRGEVNFLIPRFSVSVSKPWKHRLQRTINHAFRDTNSNRLMNLGKSATFMFGTYNRDTQQRSRYSCSCTESSARNSITELLNSLLHIFPYKLQVLHVLLFFLSPV